MQRGVEARYVKGCPAIASCHLLLSRLRCPLAAPNASLAAIPAGPAGRKTPKQSRRLTVQRVVNGRKEQCGQKRSDVYVIREVREGYGRLRDWQIRLYCNIHNQFISSFILSYACGPSLLVKIFGRSSYTRDVSSPTGMTARTF